MVKRDWVLKRNCSLSPRQLAMAFAMLCMVSLSVAAFFTLRGAWYVLCFSVIEISAVGLAFFRFARHATDREHIALIDECLVVELTQMEQTRQFKLDKRRIRVETPLSRDGLIRLESNGTRVEVGRFLTEWRRRELAQELRCALASGG
jgi:uncharacterized membrane protein